MRPFHFTLLKARLCVVTSDLGKPGIDLILRAFCEHAWAAQVECPQGLGPQWTLMHRNTKGTLLHEAVLEYCRPDRLSSAALSLSFDRTIFQ